MIFYNEHGKVVHGLFYCWIDDELSAEQLAQLYPKKLGRSATVVGRQANDGGTSFSVMASNERGICEDDVRGAVAALCRRALGWLVEPERHDPRIAVQLVAGYCGVGSGHTTGSPRGGGSNQRGRREPPTRPITARG